MRSYLFRSLLALPLLAGCTRNTLVMVVPAQPRPLVANCLPPPGTVYAPTGPADPHMLPATPELARQARMAGCAGIAFRIDTNGAPIEPRLVAEFPLGYGFGTAALVALSMSRYHPPVRDDSLHYFVAFMGPMGPPVPTIKPPGPASPPPVAGPSRAHAT